MFSINPEIIYRLPVTARAGKWSSYVGFGPGFNFVNQSFESGEDRFGEFHSAIGLNLLGGLQNRSGLFVELKASVYSEPRPHCVSSLDTTSKKSATFGFISCRRLYTGVP